MHAIPTCRTASTTSVLPSTGIIRQWSLRHQLIGVARCHWLYSPQFSATLTVRLTLGAVCVQVAAVTQQGATAGCGLYTVDMSFGPDGLVTDKYVPTPCHAMASDISGQVSKPNQTVSVCAGTRRCLSLLARSLWQLSQASNSVAVCKSRARQTSLLEASDWQDHFQNLSN